MRYYFDIRNGEGLIRDEEGQLLALPKDMRRAAAAIATDIARDEVVDQDRVELVVIVRNDAGKSVLRTRVVFEAEWLEEA